MVFYNEIIKSNQKLRLKLKRHLQLDGFAQHHFVEGPNEGTIEKVAVIDCHADSSADELESEKNNILNKSF
jgi:hypothetical protein